MNYCLLRFLIRAQYLGKLVQRDRTSTIKVEGHKTFPYLFLREENVQRLEHAIELHKGKHSILIHVEWVEQQLLSDVVVLDCFANLLSHRRQIELDRLDFVHKIHIVHHLGLLRVQGAEHQLNLERVQLSHKPLHHTLVSVQRNSPGLPVIFLLELRFNVEIRF